MYIVVACIMVRTDDIRTERVNEEITIQYTYHAKLKGHRFLHNNLYTLLARIYGLSCSIDMLKVVIHVHLLAIGRKLISTKNFKSILAMVF